MTLLDSDVLVDISRRYLPAVRWFTSLEADSVGVPRPAALELIQGCRNRPEADRILRILDRLPIFWPNPAGSASGKKLAVKATLPAR